MRYAASAMPLPATSADSARLEALLPLLPRARVLCLGDVMLDRFTYGRVERVSPEAPIPVLRVERQEAMLGGVGNVARNVVALGARALLVGVVGDDAAGAEVRAQAAALAGLDARLVVDPGRPTTEKTRFAVGSQQLLRADRERADPLAPALARDVCAAVERALADIDLLVVSDYAKGVLTDEVLATAIGLARAAGRPVVVDPKRGDVAAYRGASLLKPNAAELARATGLPVGSDAEVERAAQHLLAAADVGAVLVSRAERGLTLVVRGGDVHHVRVEAREVADVSGAGDTVVATAAVALAAGADIIDAARLAALAGSIVVGKAGTAVVRRDDLAAALLDAEVGQGEAKVATRDAALERVLKWRSRGLRVGFTNGVFDLLHPGHLTLLREARGLCDRLVVAINSDASVRGLGKGPDRPVMDQHARAVMLAGLGVVDLVVVFDEDTPVPLLELLKPDLLIKGGDYRVDQVVGHDTVRAYGGEVLVSTHLSGHGTTRTIARLRGG